jgi:glycerol-3-phosphate dehydrogenase (NAD(P)+)
MKFGIIGGGSWATALAKMLADNGHSINWWLRSDATIEFIRKRRHNPHYITTAHFNPILLNMSSNMREVIENSEALVICVPSSYLLTHLSGLPADAFAGKKIISAIKGVLPGTNQLLNEYLLQGFNVATSNYFTIMGPCHAEEVAAEKLSYLTFSGEDVEAVELIASHFKTDYLNTVINHDIWGTQYAAVLKNIYAVGAGIAHGLEYGDNFLAVYIANAANELVNFLRTVMEHKHAPDHGLINYKSSVYLGDLLVTCYSLFSRNRTFGNMIGKGYSVKVAQLEMNMVAEGYPASKGLYQINENIGAVMPIATAIYQILWHHADPRKEFAKIEEWMR